MFPSKESLKVLTLTDPRVDSGRVRKGFETTGLEAVARVEKTILSRDEPRGVSRRLLNPP